MRRILAAGLVALLAACGGSDGGGGNTNPGEPNEDFAHATPLAFASPIVVVATIADGNDQDFYSFTIPSGGRNVRFQTFDAGGVTCDPTNEGVDPVIGVFDSTRMLVGGDDDSGVQPWCEDVTVFLPEGTAYVAVAGYPPFPFVYTLRVTILSPPP